MLGGQKEVPADLAAPTDWSSRNGEHSERREHENGTKRSSFGNKFIEGPKTEFDLRR